MSFGSLAVCADDFGLSEAIDRGILRLLARGRLTAVSCLVSAPSWPRHALALRAAVEQRDRRPSVGLHFNLTEGDPLSPTLRRQWSTFPRLPRLIAQAFARRLPAAAIREELRLQLAALEDALGDSVSHLDGHQHVHALPQVRDAVIELIAERPRLKVRSTGTINGPGYSLKRLAIRQLGGADLARALQAADRSQNSVLVGVYDFACPDYRSLVRRWLAALPERGALLLCHPAEPDADDPIAAARARELAYLDGPAFESDLRDAGVRLDVPA